jgi:phosphoenolpyruvate phosphomutase
LPEDRRPKLRQQLATGRGVRLVEAHNGLSALVGSRARFETVGGTREFDGLWISSLTSSAARGLPDAELTMFNSILDAVDEAILATDKPILVDGDTGGDPVHFEYFCRKLELRGVSGIIVEDQRLPKRNSLCLDTTQHLEDPAVFARKIERGRNVLRTRDFMIFARLESFIAGAGLSDALERARAYLQAGADGIMIHSNERGPHQVYAFLDGYEALCAELGRRPPTVCVPTTYNHVPGEELFARGFDVVIHANHLLRAAHAAMEQVCRRLLEDDRSDGVTDLCSPVKRLLDDVGFTAILEREMSGKTVGVR